MNQSLISQRFKYSPQPAWRLSPTQAEAKADVERKIREDIYTFEEANCFCGSSDRVTIAECDRYGLYVSTVICPSCGIVRTSPRMTQASYQHFYDTEYRKLYGDEDTDLEGLYLRKLEQGKAVFDFVSQHLDLSSGVVFDIGCNMGAALYWFQQRGFEVAGVDYGSKGIEYGKKRTGIHDLYVGGIEALERVNQKADLIILQHVMEHFVELENELKRVYNLINPQGHVFIEVPGIYCWIRSDFGCDLIGYLQNAHTFSFSLATLTYVMECVGFEQSWGDEYIRSIYRKSETRRRKSDLPRGEFKRTINYLKRTEFLFRLVGCFHPKLQRFVLILAERSLSELLGLGKRLIKRMLGRLVKLRS